MSYGWGGNDLDNGASEKHVVSELNKIVEYCSNFTDTIYICNIESRDYSNPDRTAEYRRKARNTNRLLSKQCRKGGFRTINVSDHHFLDDSHDGIHMGDTAYERILNKIENAIEYTAGEGRAVDY